jgi:hypothetical protein
VIAIGLQMLGSDANTESENPGGSFAVATTSSGAMGVVTDFSELYGTGKSSAIVLVAAVINVTKAQRIWKQKIHLAGCGPSTSHLFYEK